MKNRTHPVARLLASAALVGLLAAGTTTASGQQAAPVADSTPILPVDEIREGMRGVGYTVVRGNQPVEFGVEILGVLRDTFPKLDLVVARLTGLGLERSNVIAGMSGSPVYVDGRMVGAVAYRMVSFGHEAIAGIVPIASMLDVQAFGAAAPTAVAGDPEAVATILASAASLLTGGPMTPTVAGLVAPPGTGLAPIATPVAMAGFRPEIVGAITPLFESLGWAPMAGGAGGGGAAVEPNLVPGGAVAVQLMRGDVSVSAAGTITWRDGDRLLAFGHPFLQGGTVDFPMVAANVLTVLSSSADSRKVSIAGDEVLGAVRQDRLPAILGVVGATPELIPVRMEIHRETRPETLDLEIVSDPILTPLYVFLGMVNGVQSIDQIYGEGSIELETRFVLEGETDPIEFGNLFSSSNQAIIGLSSTLASVFGYLYGNQFEPVRIRGVDVSIALRNDRRSATVARVWHDRDVVRPGDVVNIGVELRPHRRPPVVETMTFRVPERVPAGTLSLLVGDAQSITREEQSFLQGELQPRDLDHLVRLLNSRRRGDRIYLQASLPAEGAFVNGEVLPALPPSVLEMLTTDRTRGDVVRIGRAVVAEQAAPVNYVVSGSHRIELTVRR